VLVLVGFGQGQEQEQARGKDPRFGGRHFTLAPVHPDDVPAWAASADVTFAAPPPTSLNQRLFTPNKFWESLAGGTPVVVARASSTMRAIVERENLGVVVDSEDIEAVATGLRTILDADPVERAALRARCLSAAHDHYNWETSVQPYLALVERLAARPAGTPPTRRAASGQAVS
jgi:glycosyltransferase involved in cell wall biosynthesis